MLTFAMCVALAACNFPMPPLVGDAGGSGSGSDASVNVDAGTTPCTACALFRATPAVANVGDTITLDGLFPGPVTVEFPGGVTASATLAGTTRATVVVPAGATAGPLDIRLGTTVSPSIPFRTTTFGLGLQPLGTGTQESYARQDAQLVTGRIFHTSERIGNYVYVIGGKGVSDPINSVERALVNADGSLGAFAAYSTLTTARYLHASIVIGGYLYVIGGIGTAGALTSVERAQIQADGSLASFQPQSAGLQTASAGLTLLVIGDNLYALAGPGAVEAAPINVDGTLANFATVNVNGAQGAASYAEVGDYVYQLGGSSGGSGSATNLVALATIDATGTLGSFAPYTGINLVTARSLASAVVFGSTLYVIGGVGSDGNTVTPAMAMEAASLHTDGTLGTFVDASSLVPEAEQGASFTLVGTSLYLIGGAVAGFATPSAATLHASINASSALGTFGTSGALATGRIGAAIVASGNYVYELGGSDSDGMALTSVERAEVADDGTLGTFATFPGSTLLVGRSQFSVAAIGGYVYAIGGQTSTSATSTVERATVGSDGTLSTFASVPGSPLSFARIGHASIVLGDYVYALGGNGPTVNMSIERATIATDGSIGAFSSISAEFPYYQQSSYAFDGTLYEAGGTNGNGPVQAIQHTFISGDGSLLNFANAPPPQLAAAREGAGAVIVGGVVYFLGGRGSATLMSNIEGIALSGSQTGSAVSHAGTLVTARDQFTTIVLGNHVYALGGEFTAGNATTNVESCPLP